MVLQLERVNHVNGVESTGQLFGVSKMHAMMMTTGMSKSVPGTCCEEATTSAANDECNPDAGMLFKGIAFRAGNTLD